MRFVGTVAGGRKSALYASADLFVMPTRREGTREEGFGMVFAEAAAGGLAVHEVDPTSQAAQEVAKLVEELKGVMA